MTRYLKNMEKEIIIDNQLDEVARIALFIEELGMSLQLPAGITMSLNLAIEEAVTNIIRYGYPSNKESEIILRTSVAPGMLVTQIIDDGISFDPTAKETSDNVQSHSTDNHNELILTKNIDMDFKPEATLKTNLCQIEEVTILTIEGRLDTANANTFNTVLQPLLASKTPNIIVNCEGLSYISSSGLRSLITLQKSVMQHGGQLVLEAMKPEIRKIFDMTGCSGLFTVR